VLDRTIQLWGGLLLLCLSLGCSDQPQKESSREKQGSFTKPDTLPTDGKTPVELTEANWQKDVLQSSEPVLVDFWASWCGPCRTMNPTIEALAQDFKVGKVNIDENQGLTAQYEITSIPAFLIFKDGKLAARFVGVTPEGNLRAQMKNLSGK
jgi:thioredoxin 1